MSWLRRLLRRPFYWAATKIAQVEEAEERQLRAERAARDAKARERSGSDPAGPKIPDVGPKT